jgi:hypothetical protein
VVVPLLSVVEASRDCAETSLARTTSVSAAIMVVLVIERHPVIVECGKGQVGITVTPASDACTAQSSPA